MAKETKSAPKDFDITSSSDTLSLATDLAKFIKENRLYQDVHGKQFVNVEGWQYAGARLGMLPIIGDLINRSTDEELRYECRVDLYHIGLQMKVGAGYSICSNKEQGKKYYQEFAIASMAQTRAIGKAYRNSLSWLIKAAGYEPVPAEEEREAATEAYENSGPVKVQPKVDPPAKTETAKAKAPEPAPKPEPKPEPKMTREQEKEIHDLMKDPVITVQEKGKMNKSMKDFTESRAATAIEKLKATLKERAVPEGEKVIATEPTHKPGPGNVPATVWESEAQIELIKKLVQSHHIPEKTKANINEALQGKIDGVAASSNIEWLTRKIKAGDIYEKQEKITQDLYDDIIVLLEHADITPDEERAGKEALNKPTCTIAQGRAILERTEKLLQQRRKK